jgi:hypothetical protein
MTDDQKRKEQEELDRQWKAVLFRPINTNK